MFKIVPLVTAASLLAAGGGAFGAWTATAKSVDLVVDGVRSSVTTHDATVADVLAERDITVAPIDKLSPAPQTAVNDGSVITVGYSRDVTLNVTDGPTTVIPTTALTVGELLDTLDFLPESEVSAPPTTPIGRAGLTLDITPALEVPLAVGGEDAKPVITTGPTVDDVLTDNDVVYDDDDEVLPEPDTTIARIGDTGIVVNEVEFKKSEKKTDLDFKTERKNSSSLAKGETETQREGKQGTQVETFTEKFVNGKSVEKKSTDKKVTKEPVNKIILVGTAEEEDSDSGSGDSDSDSDSDSGDGSGDSGDSGSGGGSSDGTGPTDGEASGNTCKASYYWEPQPTANGEQFDPSAMTAAHKSLPFDTLVKVTNASNGKSVIVRINDRGPYIDGRCLDLSEAAMKAVGGTGSGVITAKWEIVG